MQRYAHFTDLIDNIAWKILRYTLTSPTQTNLVWHFPSIYSFHCRSKKDFIVCARNLRQNSYSYLLLHSCSFLLLWMCSNHFSKREITMNCLPKCIVLLSPLQISRKFRNYYAMQKNTWDSFGNLYAEKPWRFSLARNCVRKKRLDVTAPKTLMQENCTKSWLCDPGLKKNYYHTVFT